jgi:hypothetical protein
MHEAPEKTRSRRPRISERRLLIAGLVAALIVVAGALITRPDEALSRAVANRVVAAAAAHGVVVELGRARLLPFSVEFGVIEATARRPAGLPATARIDASRVVVAWVPTLSPRLGVRLTTARIEGAHAVVEDPRPAAATSAPATPAPGPAAPARPAARRATSTASTWWSLERVDAAGISVQAPGMRDEFKLVLPQGRRLDTAWQGTLALRGENGAQGLALSADGEDAAASLDLSLRPGPAGTWDAALARRGGALESVRLTGMRREGGAWRAGEVAASREQPPDGAREAALARNVLVECAAGRCQASAENLSIEAAPYPPMSLDALRLDAGGETVTAEAALRLATGVLGVSATLHGARRWRIGLTASQVRLEELWDALQPPLRDAVALGSGSEGSAAGRDACDGSGDGSCGDRPPWPVRGLIDGTVTAEGDRGRASFSTDLSFVDATVDLDALASEPVAGLSGQLLLAGAVSRADRSWQLSRATLIVGDVQLDASGSGAWPGPTATAEIDILMPPVEVGRIRRSLPPALMPWLSGARIEGAIGFRAWLDIDASMPRAGVSEFELLARDLRVESLSGVSLPEFSADRVTRLPARPGAGWPSVDSRGWVTLGELAPGTVRTLLAAEDDAFFRHSGFDWRGIERALARNYAAGAFVAGGSTLTQQVVKNVYLTQERSLARKFQEAVLTWLLEQRVPKERILEIYLNTARFGPAQVGIERAARDYFGTTARELTRAESMLLASMLPSPAVFGARYLAGEIDPTRLEKMRHVVANLERDGSIGVAEANALRARIASGRLSDRAPRRPRGAP